MDLPIKLKTWTGFVAAGLTGFIVCATPFFFAFKTKYIEGKTHYDDIFPYMSIFGLISLPFFFLMFVSRVTTIHSSNKVSIVFYFLKFILSSKTFETSEKITFEIDKRKVQYKYETKTIFNINAFINGKTKTIYTAYDKEDAETQLKQIQSVLI